MQTARLKPSKYFNPRPPRGERPHQNECACGLPEFQSTPSARRATGDLSELAASIKISIHALREESDAHSLRCRKDSEDFNPRPPRGERPYRPSTSFTQ